MSVWILDISNRFIAIVFHIWEEVSGWVNSGDCPYLLPPISSLLPPLSSQQSSVHTRTVGKWLNIYNYCGNLIAGSLSLPPLLLLSIRRSDRRARLISQILTYTTHTPTYVAMAMLKLSYRGDKLVLLRAFWCIGHRWLVMVWFVNENGECCGLDLASRVVKIILKEKYFYFKII